MDQIQLLDLPNEILAIILNYLSTMSLLLIKEVSHKFYNLYKLIQQRNSIPVLHKTIKFEYTIDAIFYRKYHIVIYNRNNDRFYITNDFQIIKESTDILSVKKQDQYMLNQYVVVPTRFNKDGISLYQFSLKTPSDSLQDCLSLTILNDTEIVFSLRNIIYIRSIINDIETCTYIINSSGQLKWNTEIPIAYDSNNNIYIAETYGYITKISLNNYRNKNPLYNYSVTQLTLPYDNNILTFITGKPIYWIVMDKLDRLYVCVGEIQVYNTDGILLFEFGKGFSSKIRIIFDYLNNPIVIDGNQVYFYYT